MRRYKILLTFLVLAFSVIVYSCSKSVDPSGDDSRQEKLSPDIEDLTGYSSADIKGGDHPDREANLMALWYGNKLIANVEDYFRFHDGVNSLRQIFGDSIPQVGICFMPPWVPYQLIICLDDSADTEYTAGNYTAWDMLNQNFFILEIEKFLSLPDNHWYQLSFASTLHPIFQAAFYETLPGVNHAEPNVYMGDGPNIYPWFINDTMTFLVREAWGDCPAGCIYNRFFYFKETDSEFDLIGIWEKWHEPEPGWWAEAKAAFDAFKYIWPANKKTSAKFPVYLPDSDIEIRPIKPE